MTREDEENLKTETRGRFGALILQVDAASIGAKKEKRQLA